MTVKTSSARKNGTEAAEPIPLRYGDDPYVWACWLYYEDHMTQGDIARDHGHIAGTTGSIWPTPAPAASSTSRSNRRGWSSLSIAQELKRHFGLHDCLVVPSDDNARPLIDRLGGAAAQALAKLLKSGDTLVVAWGRTVLAIGEQASVPGLQDVTVVQATGGTAANFAYTPELCASAIAGAVKARLINITAPAVVSTAEVRDMLLREPLIREASSTRSPAPTAGVFGISSLRPNSTIHTSGFFESVSLQQYLARNAVGVVAGRFIDGQGNPVAGPLDDRTIGISLDMLKAIGLRIAVAGGFDKVPAILAALRGGYVNVLITDAATGRGILNADGVTELDQKLSQRPRVDNTIALPSNYRTHIKKFLNDPDDVVEEMLDGVVKAHAAYIKPIKGSNRALVARTGPRPGKVGLVIGGGSGHEPCFLSYVGKGLADAVAVGNIFSSPPPGPILECTQAAFGGEGVLFVYGNYAGDVMNFDMAAEMAADRGHRGPDRGDDGRYRLVSAGGQRMAAAASPATSSCSRSPGPPATAACRSMPARPSHARPMRGPSPWASRWSPARCRRPAATISRSAPTTSRSAWASTVNPASSAKR